MLKVLLTRSKEENDLAATELSRLGWAFCLAPMLTYKNLPYDFAALPRHIIITSKHAAKIVTAGITARPLDPVYAQGQKCEAWVVGQESAAILEANPCIKITGVAKDLKALKAIISMIPEEEAAEFFASSLYLSGNIVTHDLPDYIKRDIIYEVFYADEIPEDAVSTIKNGEIEYIMAFSKNSAKNLIKLLGSYKLLPYIRHSAVIGISQEVAELFDGICSKSLHSESPNFSDMIKRLVHEKNTG